MENEILDLLKIVLDQQAVLFKKLDIIERKIDGGSRMSDIDTFAKELRKEAQKVKINR